MTTEIISSALGVLVTLPIIWLVLTVLSKRELAKVRAEWDAKDAAQRARSVELLDHLAQTIRNDY